MYTGKGSEGVLDAVIDESRKQAEAIAAMRTALETGNNEEALEVAKTVAGLKPLSRNAAGFGQ
jgi:hypothetical protein